MKFTHRQLGLLAAAAIVTTAAVSIIGCGGNNPAGSVIGTVGNVFNQGQNNPPPSDSDSGSGNPALDVGNSLLPPSARTTVQLGEAGLQTFQDTKFDPQAEDGIGQGVAVGLTSQYGLVKDQKLNDYVALVGYTVGEAALPNDQPLLFGVLDTPDVGAYSGPNGYILVTRGALLQMRDEAELAGVIGHELTHVANHDGYTAVRNAKLKGDGARFAAIAVKTHDRLGLLDVAADTGCDFIQHGAYDQPEELAADKGAVDWMSNAGYDPVSYERFMQRIAQEQGAGTPNLFSTHPDFNSRLQAVSDEITSIGKRTNGGQTNADRFMAATAGIRAKGG